MWCRLVSTAFFFFVFCTLSFVGSAAAGAATEPAGQILNLFGQVSVKPTGSSQWQPGQINQTLAAGDVVQTGPASGAAILCLDESQIKLNENTTFELRKVAPSSRLRLGEVIPAAMARTVESLYGVSQGEIWLRNKNDKFRFELETPAATAAIRGTEFNLRVGPEGVSTITLLEGKVQFANPFGDLTLEPGEEGMARPGQAPSKRVVLKPSDAVQWALYYPGLFSYQDIPLNFKGLAGASPPLLSAAAEYNSGRLPAARQAAEAVLQREPHNGAALTLLGWICLQQNASLEARDFFQRVQPGMNSARWAWPWPATAWVTSPAPYISCRPALRNRPTTPLLLTMDGYFSLLAGKPEEAQRLLEVAISRAPDFVLPQSFLAQIYLVQDRKAEARRLAEQAVSFVPSLPPGPPGSGSGQHRLF